MKEKGSVKNLLQVRIGDWTVDEVEEMATETYGFRSKAEFVRALLDYVRDNQPKLGRIFSPKAESLVGTIN